MSEPRPVDESVPDSILAELQRAFGSDGPVDGGPVDHGTQLPASPVERAQTSLPPHAPEEVPELVADAVDDPGDATAELAAGPVDGAVDEPDVGREPERRTISIGGDDDLPDLKYLDELGEEGSAGSPSSTTIVIGDDLDSSGAFDAQPPPSRSMDPRVRERRIAAKRERGRRRLLVVGAIAGVVVVVVATLAVLASSLFAVEFVDVQGAPYTASRNAEGLQAVVDDLMGEPVLLVDTTAVERELEQLPWVERAFVTTDFPNRVLVDIRERQPLATFQGSDLRWRVIDRDGRVLDVLDGQPRDYMPIEGLAPDTDPGQAAGTPFALAAQLVSALPAEIRSLTDAVTVDAASGDFGLVLRGPVAVRLGGFDRMDAKLARLLQQVREGLDDVTSLDLATDEIAVTTD